MPKAASKKKAPAKKKLSKRSAAAAEEVSFATRATRSSDGHWVQRRSLGPATVEQCRPI
jgi:hypothetical protein